MEFKKNFNIKNMRSLQTYLLLFTVSIFNGCAHESPNKEAGESTVRYANSTLSHSVEASEAIPFYNGIGEKAKYYGGNQPPDNFPKLIKGNFPSYPEVARKHGLEDNVRLEMLINEQGYVEAVHVLQGSHKVLADECVNAVKTWQFIPLKRNGQVISMWLIQDFPFRLY